MIANYVAACQAYFDYFRTKDTSSPLLKIDYTVEKDSDRNTESADQQVDDGIFEDAGILYDVNETGGVFDWKSAPLTHATRFLYFSPVFDAYYHTSGDKYAKHIMDHIRTYVDAYPIDDETDPWANYSAVDDDLIETTVVDPWNWNVVGKRLQQFCEVINLIKTSPAVTGDDLFMLLDRLSVEILYLERETEKWVKKRPAHNGTFSMIFGLTSAGMMLEDFSSAPDWRDSYLAHTVKILDAYFYDDGTCRELVTSYCASGAGNMQRLVYALREEDAVIERKEKISNTVRAVIGLSNSGAGRRLPSYGDLFAGRVKAYLYEKAAIDR
jgi:hypothetical protein